MVGSKVSLARLLLRAQAHGQGARVGAAPCDERLADDLDWQVADPVKLLPAVPSYRLYCLHLLPPHRLVHLAVHLQDQGYRSRTAALEVFPN